jgi:hypothetical protein
VAGTPLPTLGYLARKILIFNGLQQVGVCKILIADGLRAKYFLSMSYRAVSPFSPRLL